MEALIFMWVVGWMFTVGCIYSATADAGLGWVKAAFAYISATAFWPIYLGVMVEDSL